MTTVQWITLGISVVGVAGAAAIVFGLGVAFGACRPKKRMAEVVEMLGTLRQHIIEHHVPDAQQHRFTTEIDDIATYAEARE
jgi:hypothetical protein